MMFLTTFLKRKYAGQIGMFFCLVMFLAGCAGKDEAMVLIPFGEDVATELTTLENVEQDAEITPGTTMLSETTEDDPHMVYVYVCGAVRDPGVVEVPEGSRAEEALRLAGGMTAEADLFYVNLAETVTDGQKLYFPTAEEAGALEAVVKAAEEGLVNINTASAEELCALPGIGTSRAADIVRYREKNGAFQTKEDIMKVSGIKQNAYDKLCDKITVQ